MKSLQEELDAVLNECEQQRKENSSLKELIRQAGIPLPPPNTETKKPLSVSSFSMVNNESSADTKISLFRSLFRGRENIYPVRWESKAGKAGYSPACRYEWNRAFCDKLRIKCGQCENREFLPVTDKTIYDQ